MTQSNDLTIILQNILNFDTQIRQSAESQIRKLALDDFGQFILNLSIKLSNDNTETNIRLLCATLIKNLINDNIYINEWITMNKELKENIKQQILATLAVCNDSIRKSASLAIAGICKVDLPNKEWNAIFDILIGTCSNDNLTIQLTSVTTLGNIFEEITSNDISHSDILKILNGFFVIFNNTTADIKLIEETLKTIYHFTHLLLQVIQNEEQRKLLLDLLIKYILHPNHYLREWTIKIFMKLLRHYYDYFYSYINNVIDFSYEIMSKDNILKNVIYCYEIWGDIGLIEITRSTIMKGNTKSKHYCQLASGKLLPVILSHLVTDEYNDEDEWNKSKASSCLLGILSQCCDQNLLNKVLEYIGKYINSSNSNEKYAAILAFNSIVETSHKDIMLPRVIKSLSLIILNIEDKEAPICIKKISALTITKIIEYYGDYIWKEESIFEELLMKMIEILFNQSNSIIVILCNGIHYLVKAIDNTKDQSTNILSKYMNVILSRLFTLAFDKRSYNSIDNLALSCFFSMGSIIEKAALDTVVIIQLFFKQLLIEFENRLNSSLYPSTEKRYDYQQYIASLLSSCMLSTAIDDEYTTKCFNLIIESFNQRNCIYEEGISAIGSIAISMKEKFESLMTIFVPFLFVGLKSVNEAPLCTFSIYTMSDVIQSIRGLFSIYVHETLTIITHILSNPNLEKTIKLYSFNIVSDIYCFCTNEALAYFDTIMSLIGSAMQAAMIIPDTNEEIELCEYVVKLRIHLLETLSFIYTSINDCNKTKEFYPYVQPIVNFIFRINSDDIASDDDLIKYSLGLIGDFCINYNSNMKPMLRLNIIEEMINKLSKSNSGLSNDEIKKQVSLINWAKELIINCHNSIQ